MSDILFLKLGTRLSSPSHGRLREMLTRCKHLRPHEELVRQGDAPHDTYFVLEGILCRYKLCSDRRAVLAYLLPGDFCGPHPDFDDMVDHSVCALTPALVADVPQHLLQEALHAAPDLAKAIAALFLTEVRVQRQWLANMTVAADKRM